MSDHSWVPGAGDSGFPLHGLPYGACAVGNRRFLGVAIGGAVLDLAACAESGLLDGISIRKPVWESATLNGFLAEAPAARRALRARLTELLSSATTGATRERVAACLHPMDAVRNHCPVAPGDFIDFFSSHHHALRAARVRRPDAELAPNWWSLPVGYHSRAGSVYGPDEPVHRPRGQIQREGAIVYAPTDELDFELELAFVIGLGSERGRPVPASAFADHVFGITLLNDWSARDIQRWESQPLGPHLAKSFATQAGPWVLPLEALQGAGLRNPNADAVLPYLRHDGAHLFDITFEVALESEAMVRQGDEPVVVTRAQYRDIYWDGAQQLAHLTANGATVRPGDIFGSGTISGPTLESAGCLLERTTGGRSPLSLPGGDERGYLADGDTVTIRGTVQSPLGPLSLGSLAGTVRPGDLSAAAEGS